MVTAVGGEWKWVAFMRLPPCTPPTHNRITQCTPHVSPPNVINSSSNSWTWHVFLLYRWNWALTSCNVNWPWVTPYIDFVQRQLAVGYTLHWRRVTSIGRVLRTRLTLWNVNCCESVNNTSFHDRGRYAVRTTTDLFLKSVAILIISLTSLWYIVKE